MPMLIVDDTTDDRLAYRAAAEAVAGLQARGEAINQENVRNWLGVVFGEDILKIGPAMHYASRVMDGPKPYDD